MKNWQKPEMNQVELKATESGKTASLKEVTLVTLGEDTYYIASISK